MNNFVKLTGVYCNIFYNYTSFSIIVIIFKWNQLKAVQRLREVGVTEAMRVMEVSALVVGRTSHLNMFDQ